MKFKLLSMLLIASSAMADDGAVLLNKGDLAPYPGYLITTSMATKARDNSVDLTATKKINLNLTDENSLLNERLANAQKQDEFLSNQLIKEKDNGMFSKVGFFILGSLVTGAIAYGTTRALK